ncbi:Hypothetical protein NTJ_07834 [Nesidiocoris tenuis]|uniref:Uncharacterized protein n=1 Tax=Nesidiocoris tenuis TaxID=355587 RepID=A0ABN7AVS0_9HEMI|nr:Hypothetical protein NTJ_07834 [Nesidiocoris tenuis]
MGTRSPAAQVVSPPRVQASPTSYPNVGQEDCYSAPPPGRSRVAFSPPAAPAGYGAYPDLGSEDCYGAPPPGKSKVAFSPPPVQTRASYPDPSPEDCYGAPPPGRSMLASSPPAQPRQSSYPVAEDCYGAPPPGRSMLASSPPTHIRQSSYPVPVAEDCYGAPPPGRSMLASSPPAQPRQSAYSVPAAEDCYGAPPPGRSMLASSPPTRSAYSSYPDPGQEVAFSPPMQAARSSYPEPGPEGIKPLRGAEDWPQWKDKVMDVMEYFNAVEIIEVRPEEQCINLVEGLDTLQLYHERWGHMDKRDVVFCEKISDCEDREESAINSEEGETKLEEPTEDEPNNSAQSESTSSSEEEEEDADCFGAPPPGRSRVAFSPPGQAVPSSYPESVQEIECQEPESQHGTMSRPQEQVPTSRTSDLLSWIQQVYPGGHDPFMLRPPTPQAQVAFSPPAQAGYSSYPDPGPEDCYGAVPPPGRSRVAFSPPIQARPTSCPDPAPEACYNAPLSGRSRVTSSPPIHAGPTPCQDQETEDDRPRPSNIQDYSCDLNDDEIMFKAPPASKPKMAFSP